MLEILNKKWNYLKIRIDGKYWWVYIKWLDRFLDKLFK